MKKTGKKLIAAAGVTAAAAAAVSAYLTTETLVKAALDRKQPKLIRKSGDRISGATKDEEFSNIVKTASEELNLKDHETVKISGGGSVTLQGHFFPCENPKRIIVAFHGWRSGWNVDYSLISDFWTKNNCSVLYAEQRGQNNSGGDYMGFGLTERYDCVRWVNWAVCRCGKKLPVYLAGVSMGATTVLMASDLNLPENVHGIMADCGFTSPKEIWKHVAKNNLHIIYGIRGLIADSICRKKINMGLDDHSAIEALKKTNIPVLFVHGTDDNFVPVEMTFENYKACASPKRLLIVPGAGHAMSYYTDRFLYQRAVKDFWRDFDETERR